MQGINETGSPRGRAGPFTALEQARFADNLRAQMYMQRMSQTKLAEVSGVGQSTISRAVMKASVSYEAAQRMAQALGFSAEALATSAALSSPLLAEPAPARSPVAAWACGEEPAPAGTVAVPEYSVSLAAGTGIEPHWAPVPENTSAVYRLSWLRSRGINPSKAYRAKVKGDSMADLLYDGDTVLIDTAESALPDIVPGKVYAFLLDGALRVKYLFPQADRSMLLRSKNPQFHDETIPPGEVDTRVVVLGRVRDKSGPGGL